MKDEKDVKSVLPGIMRILNRFRPQIRKRRLLISGSLLALLAETTLKLLEPWPLKFVFDHVIVPSTTSRALKFGFLDGFSPMLLLTGAALGIVSIAGLRSLFSYLSTYGMSLVAIQVLAEVRSNLYSHLQRLSLTFHSQFKSGDLITRVISDIERLRSVTIKSALPMFSNSVAVIGMVGVMFWLNWELALIVSAVFPLFVLLSSRLLGRIRDFARQHRKTEGAIANTTSETIGAIKIVQALFLHPRFERTFTEQNTRSLNEGAESMKLSSILEGTVQVLMATGIALVLWRGSQVVLQQSLTAGELLVFINYLKTAFEPVRDLTKHFGQIAKATASGERVIDILDYEPHVRDLPGARPAHPFFGAVRFEQVSFRYGSNDDIDREILQDINLVVEPGQQVALVGPSGSGKSTLASLLLRLYDPSAGRILIDGQDLREYKLKSLRRQISVVMQESVLFATSIRENIAYGTLDATEREIIQAAKLANAHEFILELPHGYETVLGERGSKLSGGQRQRIAIARSAIRRSPIVILDEPTTGLDSASERLVNDALNRLTQGCTTFTISHNLQAITAADQILYVEKGRIIERGTHRQLMALAGHYATLYHLQNQTNGGHNPKGVQYALDI
jgi:ATP-binding cassette, subfamily B, bacterial